jgi:hypothetical protein
MSPPSCSPTTPTRPQDLLSLATRSACSSSHGPPHAWLSRRPGTANLPRSYRHAGWTSPSPRTKSRCGSIAAPIFPSSSLPGCSINLSKFRGGTDDASDSSNSFANRPMLGQFRSVEIQASANNYRAPFVVVIITAEAMARFLSITNIFTGISDRAVYAGMAFAGASAHRFEQNNELSYHSEQSEMPRKAPAPFRNDRADRCGPHWRIRAVMGQRM